MSAITVPRSDVTSDEVADALRQGLGSQYHVLPGAGVNCWNPVRAQVRISQNAGETILHVSPGGIGLLTLTNRLWIVHKVRQVLRADPTLR